MNKNLVTLSKGIYKERHVQGTLWYILIDLVDQFNCFRNGLK